MKTGGELKTAHTDLANKSNSLFLEITLIYTHFLQVIRELDFTMLVISSLGCQC